MSVIFFVDILNIAMLPRAVIQDGEEIYDIPRMQEGYNSPTKTTK